MINLFEPDLGKDELNAIGKVFKSKWLGRGSVAQQFNCKFAAYLNTDKSHIYTVSSCSDAIRIILEVLKGELKKGGTFLVPVNSFPVVPSAIINNGFNVRFCDIDPNTGNICLQDIKKKIDIDTVGVFVTDYGGNSVPIEKIREINKDLVIASDSACALGSFNNSGIAVGLDADFAVWSFDAMKLLICGEGGGVYIKDKELMKKFKSISYLGLPSSEKSGLLKMDGSDEWWSYDIEVPSYRSIFTDYHAACGLIQLDKINDKLNKKKRLREIYINKLSVDYLLNNIENHANYFFTIKSKNRNNIALSLRNNGIYCSLRYWRLDKTQIIKHTECPTDMPGADSFYSESLNIPIHSNLEESDIDYICKVINNSRW